MLTRRVERNSWLCAGSPLASLLVLAVHLCTCLHNVDGNVSRLGSVDTFKLVFLENEMQFQITKGFSSDFIAEEFCRWCLPNPTAPSYLLFPCNLPLTAPARAHLTLHLSLQTNRLGCHVRPRRT